MIIVMVIMLAAAIALVLGSPVDPPPSPLDRPNIVFILADDHANAAVSAYGSGLNSTPAIDRIGEEGVIFERAYCENSICVPARAALLTGVFSQLHGCIDNGATFDASQPNFPVLLHDAGYQTALFGKWHLKSDPVGFDQWEVLPGQGAYYNPDFLTADGKHQVQGYCTDIVTDKALAWLEEDRTDEAPFLLMVHNKAPHRSWIPGPDHYELYADRQIPEPSTLFDDYASRATPAHQQEMEIDRHMYMWYDLKVEPEPGVELKGPDRWDQLTRMNPEQRKAWDAVYLPRNAAFKNANLTGKDLLRWKYQRYIKNYLRCIASVDDNINRILKWLDDQGLAENTIVIYISDQGFYLGEHGWYDKRFMYEPSFRLPFVMRWPARIGSGIRDTHLVQNIDVAPTLLAAAGIEVPDRMQGESLLPLILGDASDDATWRDSLYYQYFEQGIHNVPPHHGIFTGRWKLIRYPQTDEWELFDLESDPDELNNIIESPDHDRLRQGLQMQLSTLRAWALPPSARPEQDVP